MQRSLINPMLIRFFSPQDNQKTKASPSKPKTPTLKGAIARSGTLLFPTKALDRLGLDPQNTRLRIGTPAGKRITKTLYLMPAPETTADAFTLTKAATRYTLPLAGILQQVGIDYRTSQHRFVLIPFAFEDGLTGYELTLTGGEAPKPKAPYTGKPRGRKPKATV
ncbi:hypothetical protein LC612_39685 [Nostoc sp. CHAB 5834]|nr:hypothetical protein [Nostoc sp. CHAB 5834]